MANSLEKISVLWTKVSNPLRNLTANQIEQMLQQARLGNDVRLQVAFAEIEKLTPIFQVCISKRTAGVLDRVWDVIPTDDTPEARNQADTVKRIFEKSDSLNEDGLTSALKHLCLYAFRGRSAVKPFFDGKAKLEFKALHNWNVLRAFGRFYWNPGIEQTALIDENSIQLKEIPKEEIAYVVSDSPIDMPGITLYLRQLVGEEQWARFVEKSGIAQILLATPEGTSDTELQKFNYRAQAIYEGASGTVPNGTTVTELTSARGQDPFSNYIQHQAEMISILATGGTLMTIGGSTGLGSDLARVQQESFNQLVSQDCKMIQNAINASAVRLIVNRLFGDDVRCKFQFVESDNTTPAEYIAMAQQLKSMGIGVNAEKLKELTKLQFINADEWTPSTEG